MGSFRAGGKIVAFSVTPLTLVFYVKLFDVNVF